MRRRFACLFILVIICFAAIQAHATTYSLVKTIDLKPLLGDDGAIEVDVVGDQLYVANWMQNKYFRIDAVTSTLLGSFSLGIDNHGSEYNPTTGLILHASDRESNGFGYDAFLVTNTNGQVVQGPYPLSIPNSNDPEGLTIDPKTGRVWVFHWSTEAEAQQVSLKSIQVMAKFSTISMWVRHGHSDLTQSLIKYFLPISMGLLEKWLQMGPAS